ncbi:MAG: hypothetical protein U0T73_03850 [Chitinophagales bacterium]
MKSLIWILFTVFTTAVMAQGGKVTSAWMYKESYKKGDGVSNLEEAKRLIDEAVNDPATQTSSKAWFYRMDICMLMAADTQLSNKYPDAGFQAIASLDQLQKLADPKFKNWEDAIENAKNLANIVFNDAVEAFQKKDYNTAYKEFSAIPDLNSIIESRGEKSAVPTKTALDNAALSADNSGVKDNIYGAYKKLNKYYPSAISYHQLAKYEREAKNVGESDRLIDEGLSKFPNSQELLIDKYNSYPEDKRLEGLEFLKKIYANDPKNESVLGAMGDAYYQQKDEDNAVKTYETLLSMNPVNFQANFGMGVVIYNRAKVFWDEMNGLGYSNADKLKFDQLKVKRDDLLVKARAYFEKAQSVKPDDAQLKSILAKIDSNLK